MVQGIYFDAETREFSVIEDREFGVKDKASAAWGSVKTHVGNHPRSYINAASSAVGAGAGMAIARAKAKKQAAAMGLEPGTKEYKRFMAKKMAGGAAIGGAAGLGAGELTTAGLMTRDHYKMHKALYPAAKKGEVLKESLKSTGRAMYVTPVKNVVNAVTKKGKKA